MNMSAPELEPNPQTTFGLEDPWNIEIEKLVKICESFERLDPAIGNHVVTWLMGGAKEDVRISNKKYGYTVVFQIKANDQIEDVVILELRRMFEEFAAKYFGKLQSREYAKECGRSNEFVVLATFGSNVETAIHMTLAAWDSICEKICRDNLDVRVALATTPYAVFPVLRTSSRDNPLVHNIDKSELRVLDSNTTLRLEKIMSSFFELAHENQRTSGLQHK